jgi:outer membrane protein OmpA-like peptidoglycan-associated protein
MSLKSKILGGMILAGCAASMAAPVSTAKPHCRRPAVTFQKVKEDSNVLRIAPKDVIRAGESLARADRLSSYWGSGADVVHYAYLSQRYSEIAREHTNQVLNEERAAKLELERQRLQLALRESKLLSVQQQGKWLEEQIALATTQTDRGLVMTLGDVLFDTGEAELKNSANRVVLKIVQFLQLNPKRVVHRGLHRQHRWQTGKPQAVA